MQKSSNNNTQPPILSTDHSQDIHILQEILTTKRHDYHVSIRRESKEKMLKGKRQKLTQWHDQQQKLPRSIQPILRSISAEVNTPTQQLDSILNILNQLKYFQADALAHPTITTFLQLVSRTLLQKCQGSVSLLDPSFKNVLILSKRGLISVLSAQDAVVLPLLPQLRTVLQYPFMFELFYNISAINWPQPVPPIKYELTTLMLASAYANELCFERTILWIHQFVMDPISVNPLEQTQVSLQVLKWLSIVLEPPYNSLQYYDQQTIYRTLAVLRCVSAENSVVVKHTLTDPSIKQKLIENNILNLFTKVGYSTFVQSKQITTACFQLASQWIAACPQLFQEKTQIIDIIDLILTSLRKALENIESEVQVAAIAVFTQAAYLKGYASELLKLGVVDMLLRISVMGSSKSLVRRSAGICLLVLITRACPKECIQLLAHGLTSIIANFLRIQDPECRLLALETLKLVLTIVRPKRGSLVEEDECTKSIYDELMGRYQILEAVRELVHNRNNSINDLASSIVEDFDTAEEEEDNLD